MTHEETEWFRQRPPTCHCYTFFLGELGVKIRTYTPLVFTVIPYGYKCPNCGTSCNLKGAKAHLHLITPKSRDGKTIELKKTLWHVSKQ